MKNVTSDKYISFALSLLSSIAILVFKDDTTETGRIIIYCILGAVILGYLVYFAVQFSGASVRSAVRPLSTTPKSTLNR